MSKDFTSIYICIYPWELFYIQCWELGDIYICKYIQFIYIYIIYITQITKYLYIYIYVYIYIQKYIYIYIHIYIYKYIYICTNRFPHPDGGLGSDGSMCRAVNVRNLR